MVELLIYVALGFLLASMLSVVLAPPLWRRAVRLTTRRLESTMPMTVADIQADKDELRAEFAIKSRQLELALEKSKDQSAQHLVERNRNQVLARHLKSEHETLKVELATRSNEAAVLQQNISSGIPKLTADTQALQALSKEKHRIEEDLENFKNERAAMDKKMETAGQANAEKLKTLGTDNKHLTSDVARLKLKMREREKSAAYDNDLLRREIRQLANQIVLGAAEASRDPDARAQIRPSKANSTLESARERDADGIQQLSRKTSKRSGLKGRKSSSHSNAETINQPKSSLTARIEALAEDQAD